MKDKNLLPKSCLHKWTYESMLCYRIGCNCLRCSNNTLESGCRMRDTVFALVKKFGIPQRIIRTTNNWRRKEEQDDVRNHPEYRINTGFLREKREMLQPTLQE